MMEWKKLGEIANVSNGERPISEILEKGRYPYINAGRTNSGYLDNANSKGGAVTTPSHGEGGIGSVQFQYDEFWCGALCYKMYTIERVHCRYLFHFLNNNSNIIISCKNVGGQPYINRKQLEKILIPVPTISEQQRIVEILDTFTSSIDNLKQQIEQRRKQYEFYRDNLLNLDGEEGVEMVTIGEVCTTITPPQKIAATNYQPQGLFPIIDQGQSDIVGYTDDESALLPYEEYVLFGDHTRFVKYYKGKFAQGADGLKILKTKDFISPRFFYFAFSNIEIPSRGYSRHWSIAKEFHITVPPTSEQQRIVSILDTFEHSIQNLEEQLKLREKQYEYYRNKLLTFE